jgi:hypothetical protein
MLSLSLTNTISVVLIGLNLVLLIWVIWLSLAVRRQGLARQWVAMATKDNKTTLMDIVEKSALDIDRLFAKHDRLAATVRENREVLGESIKHVGLVRYDAFPEVGGRLSFSAALLNEKGDGLVITAISGRSESRSYAKPIIERRSSYPLSREEEQSIVEAFKGVKV